MRYWMLLVQPCGNTMEPSDLVSWGLGKLCRTNHVDPHLQVGHWWQKKHFLHQIWKLAALGGQECAQLPELAMENGKATINGHQVASEVSVTVRASCDLDIQPVDTWTFCGSCPRFIHVKYCFWYVLFVSAGSVDTTHWQKQGTKSLSHRDMQYPLVSTKPTRAHVASAGSRHFYTI